MCRVWGGGGVETGYLGVCDLSVLSTVSLFFFAGIGDVLALSTKFLLISLICQLCQF